jgi:acyl-CoA thioesterase
MADGGSLREVLELEQVGDGRFVAQNHSGGHGLVVFGGQLLAQSIIAGATIAPDKYVKTIHLVFARGADASKPLEIEVDTMAAGRAMASSTVTISQEGRLCTRALVSLTVEEPDLIRHGLDMPQVAAPDELEALSEEGGFWDARILGGVDLMSADVGPAELDVWTCFPGERAEGVLGQALLSYATDGFLIGTAMRPHEGISQAMSHVSISTSVLSHTLTFHEPVDASAWHLLVHESPYAGRGRSYGRAHIFAADGRLVASFVQDNMIRDFPKGQAPAAGERSKF